MLKVFTIIDVLKSDAGSTKNVGRKQNVHVIGSAVGNLLSEFQKCCYLTKVVESWQEVICCHYNKITALPEI